MTDDDNDYNNYCNTNNVAADDEGDGDSDEDNDGGNTVKSIDTVITIFNFDSFITIINS